MIILIVDDETIVIESCRRILAVEGHEIVVAENVPQARQYLESDAAFDLVITDIKMPGADGFGLIAEARRLRPDISILMMTGFLTPETIERGNAEGVDGCIAKPFTPEELLKAIDRVIPLEKWPFETEPPSDDLL